MFTKRNILTPEQRAKGLRTRWAKATQEERINHSMKMNEAQGKGLNEHLDPEAIIGELEAILANAASVGDAQTSIRAINALGQWHRLKEYKASKGAQAPVEKADIDEGVLAELEKNAASRERDEEKLN